MQAAIEQLSALTADLYFTSETDARWTIHALDPTQGIENQLLTLAKLPVDTSLETRDWATFLVQVATPQDWMDEAGKAAAARYKTMIDYINTTLTDVTVYRFGSIEIAVFVVGLASDCTPIALATQAVET